MGNASYGAAVQVRFIAATLLALATSAVAARAPDAAGRFAVGSTTVTVVDASRAGRTLVTEVWCPAEAAGRDTQLRRGRFPLVLLAHGFCGSRTNYEYLSSHLASWGFLVAAPGFTDVDSGLTPDALARQQRLTRRYATAFLERHLVGHRHFSRFLCPADATGQQAGVEIIAASARCD